jgi:hypothetical protein
MHSFCLFGEHEKQAPKTMAQRSSNTLSHVYIDDAGHIIAVFSDDTEMDVTKLFDVLKQC